MLKILRDFIIYMALAFTVVLAISTSMNILDLKINFGRPPGIYQDVVVDFWMTWKDVFTMTAMSAVGFIGFLFAQYKDGTLKK